jgi:hypothetical protein
MKAGNYDQQDRGLKRKLCSMKYYFFENSKFCDLMTKNNTNVPIIALLMDHCPRFSADPCPRYGVDPGIPTQGVTHYIHYLWCAPS